MKRTPEIIEKARITRERNKEESDIMKASRPIVYLTGKEVDGFDCVQAVRYGMRKARQYVKLHILEMEIRKPSIYQNMAFVKSLISKDCDIVIR